MKNVGGVDRILRIVVGMALIGAALVLGNPWLYVGIVPLFTGAVGFCPLYPLLKINTCSKQ